MCSCVVLGIALVCVAGPAASQAPTAAGIDFKAANFEANDGRVVAAQVANFKVPERHEENRTGGLNARAGVTLRVWRFTATGSEAGPPIVVLAGGPGGAAIGATRGVYFDLVQRFRAHGDVIIADQRGTGESKPSLACDTSADMAAGESLTIESWLEALRPPAARCARKWTKKGTDLAAFNSSESANDIEAIREAIGADQLSLWGISYGTQLALTYMRQYPDRVARAVLHGVLPPDGFPGLPKSRDKVLKNLAKLARKAQPALYPDLVGSLRTILADLADSPRDVVIDDPRGGGPVTVRFGEYELQFVLNLAVLGSRGLMRRLPAWIAAMESGDYAGPAAVGLELRRWSTTAMSMAVTCATGENPKRARKAAKQAPRSVTGAQPSIEDACDPWGVDPLGGETLEPVSSSVPVLLAAGTLDGTTPFADAKSVSRKLRNSHLLKLVGATHSDLVHGHADILEVVDEFLAGSVPSRKSIVLGWNFDLPTMRTEAR